MVQKTWQMDDLKKALTEALCEVLQGKYLTVENIADYLLSSNLIHEQRARQFLAIKEFYDRYDEDKKTILINQISAKWGVSERTMWSLAHKKRRFKI